MTQDSVPSSNSRTQNANYVSSKDFPDKRSKTATHILCKVRGEMKCKI